MKKHIATVIKTGNSYAFRIPKGYVDQYDLKVGQKIPLDAPRTEPVKHNPEAFRRAVEMARKAGAFSSIKDPVAWQREIRKDRPLPGRD